MTKTSKMIREISWGESSNYFIKLFEYTLNERGQETVYYLIEFMSPGIEFLCNCKSLCRCENSGKNKIDNPTLLIGTHMKDMNDIFDNMSEHLDDIRIMNRPTFIKWTEKSIQHFKEVSIFCDYCSLW
jgi:hypothetical protein